MEIRETDSKNAAETTTECKEENMTSSKGPEDRDTWGSSVDFVMSALSFAVGMGNLWRFPYLCYRSGGGAFLIPYILSMVLAGYPLMFIELALGQYAGKGIVSVWKICPLFEGIGWGMLCVSVFTGIYYNMIVAWCFFYMFASFARDVPWRGCNQPWNTQNCATSEQVSIERNCTTHNGTWFNSTCLTVADLTGGQEEFDWLANISTESASNRTSPTSEFFNNYMLDVSAGFHDLGSPRWQLALCLLFSWIIVFVALARGIKVSGKVTYITALIPYVVLSILLVKGVTLPGAREGILYYITPDFKQLLNPRIWGDAAVQAFFSLSLCWGGLVSLASFNRFHNNCLRDTILVATGDMMTSIFGGFVIFAFIGYMAWELQLPIDKVAAQGPGLAFVVYPEAVAKLPVSPLWAILFMLMLINIGIGSQMGLVSTVHTTLLDECPALFNKGRRSLLLLLVISVAGYLLALTMTTRGGIYMLLVMDTYSATYALLILALAECIAIGWIYGPQRFYSDIAEMTGFRVSAWWWVCWRVIDPMLILVGVIDPMFIMLIIGLIISDFRRSSYRDYVFPVIWDVIGWGISILAMICVPVVAIFKLCDRRTHKTFKQRLQYLCEPHPDWGPRTQILKTQPLSEQPEKSHCDKVLHTQM